MHFVYVSDCHPVTLHWNFFTPSQNLWPGPYIGSKQKCPGLKFPAHLISYYLFWLLLTGADRPFIWHITSQKRTKNVWTRAEMAESVKFAWCQHLPEQDCWDCEDGCEVGGQHPAGQKWWERGQKSSREWWTQSQMYPSLSLWSLGQD